VGHAARMGQEKCIQHFIGKTEGRNSLGRQRRRWEYKVNMVSCPYAFLTLVELWLYSFFGLGTRWKCVQLHDPAALPQEKSPWYPLDRMLCGP